MRILIALLALAVYLPNIAAAQRSFSGDSRLRDSSYVATQIKEISDADLWRAVDLDPPGLHKARAAVRAGAFSRAAACWADYWNAKRQPSYITRTDHLLIDTDQLVHPDQFLATVRASPEERDTILARAEMMRQNIIRPWGDYIINFGAKVDFNREVGQSGKYGFHYWFWSRPLLMAAVLTREQKYLATFDQLFNSWYEQRNAITSTIPNLDVVYYELGLGVRNRMFIEYYLLPYKARTARTHERLLKTFLAAGRWLHELQQWEGYRPGNWQIHGSYMLVQLALAFPEFRESGEWLRVGLQRMTEHLDQDFFEDGGHSERAPRNYTLATYLSFRNLAYLLSVYQVRKDVATRINASLGRTVEWWISMLTPTGEVPAINDSHRGLFPTTILTDSTGASPLPYVSGILRNLFGVIRDQDNRLPAFTSRHMPASGFSIMRTDWTRDALYLSVNYGPAGGFHTHFDLLDFELYAYGKPLAVDAGLGLTYDDPLYQTWYRSSRAHNMVAVNDSNIRREGVQGEKVQWGSTPSIDYFAAEHRGYERFGVRHRRQIAFVKPSYWFVLDDLRCTRSGDTLSWYFHSPARLLPSGEGFASTSSPGIRVFPAGSLPLKRSGTGWAASTSLTIPGKTEEISWIRFDQISSRDSTSHFAILLEPFREPNSARSTQRITAQHFVVRSADLSDHLYFTNGSYSDGTVDTDGVFVRIALRNGAPSQFVVVNGTYLTYNGKTLWRAAIAESGEGNFQP